MPADIAAYAEAMRVYIAKTIPILTQEEADFWGDIKAVETVKTNYKGYWAPIEVSPHASFAVGSLNGGDLAYTHAAGLSHLLIPYISANSGFEETYEAMLNADAETHGEPQQHLIDAVMRCMLKMANIYASNGDGTTKLAIVSANYSGGSPTVLTCNTSTDSFGATQLRVGQKVLVYDATGTTQRVGTVGAGALTIASLTKTAVTFSTNAPSDTVATDIIVPVGSSTVGQKGVPYLVSATGSLFNLARSGALSLQSTMVSAGGSALSQSLMLQVWEGMKQRAGTKKLRNANIKICTASAQHQAYFLLTLATGSSHQFIHQAGAPKIDLGGASFEFSFFNIPIDAYLDFPGNAMYYLSQSNFKKAELKAIGQISMGTGEWQQKYNASTGTYASARQRWYDDHHDQFIDDPSLHGGLISLDLTGLRMQKS